MKRRLFNFLLALSLAFCLASAAMWVRSYSHVDHYSWQSEQRIPPIKLPQGLLPMTLPSGIPMPIVMDVIYAPKPLIYSERGCICYTRDLAFDASTGQYIRYGWTLMPFFLPYWLLVLVFAALPAYWAFRRRALRIEARRAGGFCPKCDYDLRATPNRCPECGWLKPKDNQTE